MKRSLCYWRRFVNGNLFSTVALLWMTAGAGLYPATGATPGARIDYALSFYPPLHSVVMQGGWGPSDNWEPTAEAWKLDAAGWELLSMPNAPAFAHHSLALDEQRQVLVLAGQANMGTAPHQIWEFAGSTWTKVSELTGTTYADAEITYDTERQRLVLYRASFDSQVETWEFDGSGWQQMSFSQKPVACPDGALLKYDERLHRVVLVGSGDFGGATETWLWDGTNWSKASGSQPPNAATGGMAFDRARNQMVLLATDMKTWTFDGNNWTQQTPAHSPPYSRLGFFSLAYDPERRLSVFFSGEAANGAQLSYPTSTWEWDGMDWKEFTPGATEPPRLTIQPGEGQKVRLSWPLSAGEFKLESKGSLDPSAGWEAVSATVATNGAFSVILETPNGSRFFRLKKF